MFKIATEVYTADDIKFQDGTEVSLVPLAIARLRKFMRIWGEFLESLQENNEKPKEERWKDSEISERQFDVFTELTVLSLEKSLKGERSDEEFKEWVEDTVDEQTIYRILDKCGGLKLSDPKLGELAALMESQAQDGTN